MLLAELLPVEPVCHMVVAFELTIKVGKVIEANLIGNLQYSFETGCQ